MLIVADTGPLISLIQIGQLSLLESLHSDFIIPNQVFAELIRYEPIQKFADEIKSLESHIKKTVNALPDAIELDIGEQACVALYYEWNADAILIEDRAARDWAEKQGINCLGSIALLIQAKWKGLIAEIKPSLLQMRANKRYISEELLYKALNDAGEKP